MAHERGLDCLQCGAGMSQRREHGVTIDYCPDCGGVWLDPGELEALTDGHHKRHVDVDVDDVFEEDEETEEAEEEDGGLLGTIASALGGDEGEWDDEGEFEEDEGWDEEADFGGGEEF